MEFTRNIKGKKGYIALTQLYYYFYIVIYCLVLSVIALPLLQRTRVYNQQQHDFLKNVHQNTNKSNFSLLMSVYAVFF